MEWILAYIAFSIIFGGIIEVFGDFWLFYKQSNALGRVILLPIVLLALFGLITTKIVTLLMNKSNNIDKWWDSHCTKKQ